jgi:hypothetical protein
MLARSSLGIFVADGGACREPGALVRCRAWARGLLPQPAAPSSGSRGTAAGLPLLPPALLLALPPLLDRCLPPLVCCSAAIVPENAEGEAPTAAAWRRGVASTLALAAATL